MQITTVQALLNMLIAAPSLVGFAQKTLLLFQNNSISETQLTELWIEAGNGVHAAVQRWRETPNGPAIPQ